MFKLEARAVWQVFISDEVVVRGQEIMDGASLPSLHVLLDAHAHTHTHTHTHMNLLRCHAPRDIIP